MRIRQSVESDKASIYKVHFEAFGKDEREIVAHLVVDLMGDPSAQPVLSLVAEDDRKIIGHILFSTVEIEGAEQVSAYILSPMAVLPGSQKKGLGLTLINEGLKILQARNAQIVLVLGDPNFYSRSGFSGGHELYAPYDLPYPEAWMALELTEGILSKTKGVVRCAEPLTVKELW